MEGVQFCAKSSGNSIFISCHYLESLLRHSALGLGLWRRRRNRGLLLTQNHGEFTYLKICSGNSYLRNKTAGGWPCWLYIFTHIQAQWLFTSVQTSILYELLLHGVTFIYFPPATSLLILTSSFSYNYFINSL